MLDAIATDLAWIVPKHPRVLEIMPLLVAVNDFAGVDPCSLLVYLDDTDHSAEAGVAEDFRFPGLFLNAPQVGSDTPEPVRQAILHREGRQFIWLSKTLLDGPVAKIVWVYSHELRHVLQKSEPALVASIALVLRRFQALESGPRFENLDRAMELDSELFAYRCASAILGDTLKHHIADEKVQPTAAVYFERLESILAFKEASESDACKSKRISG